MKVYAAELFERASLWSEHRNHCGIVTSEAFDGFSPSHDVYQTDPSNFFCGCVAFEQDLIEFLASHPSFDDLSGLDVTAIRARLFTYTLAQVAVIQLYGSSCDMTSTGQTCLKAAQAVVAATNQIPNVEEWKYVDPFMGVRSIFTRGLYLNLTRLYSRLCGLPCVR